MGKLIITTIIVSLLQVSFSRGQVVSSTTTTTSTSSTSSSSSSSASARSIGGGAVGIGGGAGVGGGSTIIVSNGGGGGVINGANGGVIRGGINGGAVGGINGGVVGGINGGVVGGINGGVVGGINGGVVGGINGGVISGGGSNVVSTTTVVSGGSTSGGIVRGGVNGGVVNGANGGVIIGGGVNGGIINGGGINGGVITSGGSSAAASASASASSSVISGSSLSIVEAPAPIIIPAVVSANDIAAPDLIPIPVPTPGTATTNVLSIISQSNTQVTQEQIIQLRVTQTSLLTDIEGAIEALEAAKLQAAQQANTWYFPTPELRKSFFDTFVTVEDLINQAKTYANGANRLLNSMEVNNIYLQLAWLDRVQKLQGQAALAIVRASEARALILSQISQVTTDMNLYREGRDEQLVATKTQIDQAVRTVAEETQLLGVRIRDILSRAILEWSVLLRNSLGAASQIQIDQMNTIAQSVLTRLTTLKPGELDTVLIDARTAMEKIRSILYASNLSASQISGSISPVTGNIYSLFGGSGASASASASAAASAGGGGAAASAAASASASASAGGRGGQVIVG